MPEAFILFKTEPSHERDVYLSLTSHKAVQEVHALYGEFDLLARISSDSAQSLTNLLMKEFRTIQGIRDTQTLIVLNVWHVCAMHMKRCNAHLCYPYNIFSDLI